MVVVFDNTLVLCKNKGMVATGVRLYGYGTEKGGEMFLKDQYSGEYEQVSYYDWDTGYNEITISEYDPVNAKKIAKEMGVPLIHRESDRDFEELEDLVDQIKEETLSNTENGVEDTYGDVYYIFAWPIALITSAIVVNVCLWC